jgi:DNA invertase Pin-like site-specific DNA recombinase
VRFFLEVLDDSGVSIRFAEFAEIDPVTDEGRMLLINMANFAEFEGRRIGSRTRVALAAAKARGVQLGRAGLANLRPNIEERQHTANEFAAKLRFTFDGMKTRGLSQRGMVTELNSIGVPAPKGGRWQLSQVQRLIARMQLAT